MDQGHTEKLIAAGTFTWGALLVSLKETIPRQ